MSLLEARRVYKPFSYPWAHEAWEIQNKIHWMPEEVPLADDVKDWKYKLTDNERSLLTQIFRFFTQMDVEVNDCYMTKYSAVFKPTEIKMMLAAFANMETIHVAAYSLLLDTIGMPETEYSAFLQYKEMRDKADYLEQFDVSDKRSIARTLAGVSAMGEGVSLFASFVMLLNFPRQNKMKGMGQIVSWSVRDESLHCANMIRLFREFIRENPEIYDDELKRAIYDSIRRTVELEDAFVDLAYAMGPVEGVTAAEIKAYIRYIADRRAIEMGLRTVFGVKSNPLPWVDSMISGVEHTNFFENRPTQYAKASSTGKWEDAYADLFPEAEVSIAA